MRKYKYDYCVFKASSKVRLNEKNLNYCVNMTMTHFLKHVCTNIV